MTKSGGDFVKERNSLLLQSTHPVLEVSRYHVSEFNNFPAADYGPYVIERLLKIMATSGLNFATAMSIVSQNVSKSSSTLLSISPVNEFVTSWFSNDFTVLNSIFLKKNHPTPLCMKVHASWYIFSLIAGQHTVSYGCGCSLFLELFFFGAKVFPGGVLLDGFGCSGVLIDKSLTNLKFLSLYFSC